MEETKRSRVEVLCATMNQKDVYIKYEDMNINTDVVFANQSDYFAFEVKNIGKNEIKIITTNYRGVGNNRNLALLNATSDICIFADDDIRYMNDYEKNIERAYDELPDADIIVFNCISQSKERKKIKKIHRVRYWNFMRYGTIRITAKTRSIKKHNLTFSELFGGGSKYCSGEDNLFLKEALDKGLKVYAYPCELLNVNEEKSTWFEGYNEKYFFDHGAWIQASFPKLKYILIFIFFLKFKIRNIDNDNISIRNMILGARGYKKDMSFIEWKNKMG